jgi:hypothetical protein
VKNSADIHIVIDILDLLTRPTHFDEVILLSADADYTRSYCGCEHTTGTPPSSPAARAHPRSTLHSTTSSTRTPSSTPPSPRGTTTRPA